MDRVILPSYKCMTSPLLVYNDVRTGLESIFRSRLQMQILLSLGEGCKTLSDLREITGSSSQALIPKIRALEKRYFISSNTYQYCLTSLGKVLETKIADFTKFFATLTYHDEFWKDHYLQGIPDQFIQEMSDLYNSHIIADTSVEIFQVYAYYHDIIKKSRKICWISSLVSPGHIHALTSRVSEGTLVEMIVTREVEAQLHEEPYSSLLRQLGTSSSYHWYLTDDPVKFSIMVSETRLILGLFKEDMLTFDVLSHFVSSDPLAVSWGAKVFSYFRDSATFVIGNHVFKPGY